MTDTDDLIVATPETLPADADFVMLAAIFFVGDEPIVMPLGTLHCTACGHKQQVDGLTRDDMLAMIKPVHTEAA